MTVTEFTQLTLQNPSDDLDFLEAIIQCLETQDEWVRKHQPVRLIYTHDSLSSIYVDKTSPENPTILVVASWDSPQAHQEWLNSQSYKQTHQEVRKYLPGGGQGVTTCYLEAAGSRTELPSCIRQQDRFTVGIFSVRREDRDNVQAQYRIVEKKLHEQGLRGCTWAGWALDANKQQDKLIAFWDRSVPSTYVNNLLGLSDQKTIHQYQHPGHDSFSG